MSRSDFLVLYIGKYMESLSVRWDPGEPMIFHPGKEIIAHEFFI